jgi:DNA-binding response OmpR family regulator
LLRRTYGDLSMPVAGERFSFGSIIVDMGRLEVSKDGKPIMLTPMEFRLLSILVSNPNRPYNRDALIEKIWGYTSDIGSDRTIDVHIRHLREKLEDDPANPRWLVTVRGVGYKFAAE